MNIQIVRLASGEEILCDLVINGDAYTLKQPAVIIPTGNGNIGFARWLPYANANAVTLSKKFVVFVVDPAAQLINKYNEMTNPLTVPVAKEIVGLDGAPIQLNS
jgi:hypothetical protein